MTSALHDWRLAALRQANVVFLVPPAAGRPRAPAFEAFVSLSRDHSAVSDARALLQEWLHHGSGPPQIYAALLLGGLDAQQGRAALHELAESPVAVQVALGESSLTRTTIGVLARALLTGVGPTALGARS